jgi:hypothetical protein
MNGAIIPLDAIKAYIASEQERLGAIHASEVEKLTLQIRSGDVRAWAYGVKGDDRYAYRFGEGQTFEEAIADLLNKMEASPGHIAQLREQARQILRRARELEEGSK